MNRALVRAAASSLGLRSIRPVSGHAVVSAVALLAACIEYVCVTQLQFGAVFTTPALVLLGLPVAYALARRSTRAHNDAVGLMIRGRFDEATPMLTNLLRGYPLRSVCELTLINLAEIANWQGDFDAAVVRLRGAEQLTRRDEMREQIRSRLALALACKGDLEEAMTTLALVDAEKGPTEFVARAAITKALVALKKNDHVEAAAVLAASRPMFRTAILGPLLPAVGDAIDAITRSGAAQPAYRDNVRALTGLAYSPVIRAAVARAVPGSEGVLGGYDSLSG